MVKKKSTPKKHISTTNTHILLKKSVFIYSTLVFIIFALIVFVAGSIMIGVQAQENAERKARIMSVYDSLKLGDSYRPVKQNVFGEKQPYEGDAEWAKGRSHSSSVEYSHLDTPDNTRAELIKKIEAAGFKKIGGAYEDSIAPQDHFKNSDDEYVRLSVTNKLIQDEMIYGPGFTDLGNPARMDRSTAPSYITLKVNLDDNNE